MIYNSRVPNKSRPDGASEKEGRGRRRRRERFSSFLSLPPSAAVFLSFLLFFLSHPGRVTKAERGRWPSSPSPSFTKAHKKRKKTHRVKFIHPPLQLIFFEWLTEAMHTFSHKPVMNKITHARTKKIWDGGKKRNSRPARILQRAPQTFYFSFFSFSLSRKTSGRILNKKKKKSSKERRGENCPLTEKAISVGVRLAAPRFLAGLIAFHYKFPPQPIRDRSAAVRPADTHALIGALFSDTRLMTERRAGRSACSHTYSSCTHFLHTYTHVAARNADFTQIYHEKTSIFLSFLIQPVLNYPPLMWEDASCIREPINRAGWSVESLYFILLIV